MSRYSGTMFLVVLGMASATMGLFLHEQMLMGIAVGTLASSYILYFLIGKDVE